MDWSRYGPNAILLRFAERVGEEAFRRCRALVSELEQNPIFEIAEYVPAFTTMLIEFKPDCFPDATELNALLQRLEHAAEIPAAPGRRVHIPVVYNGPDLRRVADLHRLSIEEVCQLHCSPVYRVYAIGFSPGFPYLGELDPRLHTPRLPSPRSRVRAGSVAIGGEHTGIYSIESPGGWNIIGHTPTKIFDPRRFNNAGETMFLLHAGDEVKFVPLES